MASVVTSDVGIGKLRKIRSNTYLQKYGQKAELAVTPPRNVAAIHDPRLVHGRSQTAHEVRPVRRLGQPEPRNAMTAAGGQLLNHDFGYVDLEEKGLQPVENRFGPKVLPMS